MTNKVVQAQTIELPKTRLNFDETKILVDWVALINDRDNPPLGENVVTILKTLSSDSVDLSSIMRIFESDELKNKILRIANDVYFNPAEPNLNNIKRAMIVLGFRSLYGIGLSMALYSYLLKNTQDDVFMKEIAVALHSATLAGIIAKRKIRSLNCEPLITATLLFPLGKLLFLSFGGENAKKYAEQSAQEPISEEEEEAIVGFLLKNLTTELSKKWLVGPILVKSQEATKDDDIIHIIHLSRNVVQALKVGWDLTSTEDVLQEMADFLAIPLQQAKSIALESTLRSLETFSLFTERLLEYIPLAEEAESGNNDQAANGNFKVNPSRVTASIQEMSILLGNQKSPSMSDILAIGLRSIRNSLDIDRVVFALLNQDRLSLKGRSIDEKKNSGFLNNFKFDLNASEGWLFNFLLHERRSCWVRDEGEIVINKLRNHSLNLKVGRGAFLITPFVLRGNIMGFYYADRQISSRKLDKDTYLAFKELCVTINGFVELIMMRTRQKKQSL